MTLKASEMIYFFDKNNAGVLYYGTEADVDLLRQHGGSPDVVSEPRMAQLRLTIRQNTVYLQVDGKEEQWLLERANFAQPWW
jgi:hypothetical protein